MSGNNASKNLALESSAIVLAAGKGSRFGGDKLMAILPSGERVIDAVMNTVAEVFENYLCVVRKGDTRLQQHLQSRSWPWIVADEAEQGMSRSLIAGVEALASSPAWLFMLADMPFVKPSTLLSLKNALEVDESEAKIVIPECSGKTGNPIGLSHHFRSDLNQLTGDVGARAIVKKNVSAQTMIPVFDDGIFFDIDRPEDIVR